MNECIAVIWAQQGLFTVCGPRKKQNSKEATTVFWSRLPFFPRCFSFGVSIPCTHPQRRWCALSRAKNTDKGAYIKSMLSDFEVIQIGFKLHVCISYPSGFLAYRVSPYRSFTINCIFVCLVFSFGSLHIVIVLQPHTAYLFFSFPARPLNDAPHLLLLFFLALPETSACCSIFFAYSRFWMFRTFKRRYLSYVEGLNVTPWKWSIVK